MPMAIAWRTFALFHGENLLFIPKYIVLVPSRSLTTKFASPRSVSRSSLPGLSMPSTAPLESARNLAAPSLFHWNSRFGVSALVPQ